MKVSRDTTEGLGDMYSPLIFYDSGCQLRLAGARSTWPRFKPLGSSVHSDRKDSTAKSRLLSVGGLQDARVRCKLFPSSGMEHRQPSHPVSIRIHHCEVVGSRSIKFSVLLPEPEHSYTSFATAEG